MRIADLYSGEKPVISFEFSPPKTDKGFTSLFRTIEELKHIDPGFVSVTMGAGGSTRRKTVELVTQIQRELGITAMAHLPVVGFERSEIAAILDRLGEVGLENVLALSGDPPRDDAYTPAADGFRYASELVGFIREGGWNLCVGGGCTRRVARGGSYSSASTSLRSAKREKFVSDKGYDDVGIRLVRELP